MLNKISKFSHLGSILILIAASLWAVDGILRRTLFALPPITIVFYEHLIGTLIILPFAAPQIRKLRNVVFSRSVIKLTLIVSILSGLIGTLLFTQALLSTNFIPFSIVFLLQKLQPLFAITFAVVFLKEKLSRNYLIWAGVALVAAYFATFPNGIVNTSSKSIFAALAALGAAAAWGSATVFSKMLIKKTSETVATALRFSATTLFALPTVFILGAQASLTTLTPSMFLRLVVIALSTGMVALWLYYTGLKTTKARVSTILELLFPFLAVAIDAFLYKTYLLPSQYLAAVLLLGAMVMVSRTNQETQKLHLK